MWDLSQVGESHVISEDLVPDEHDYRSNHQLIYDAWCSLYIFFIWFLLIHNHNR